MANIAITSQCNLDCAYCFTKEIYGNDSGGFGHMSLSVFQKALEFKVATDIKQILQVLYGIDLKDFFLYMMKSGFLQPAHSVIINKTAFAAADVSLIK